MIALLLSSKLLISNLTLIDHAHCLAFASRNGLGSHQPHFRIGHTTALLDVKPDLVKRIGNTTFDIHIHFSETSRETLHTEMGNYTLNSGDALVFDSSVKHTYINEQDVMLTFMVVNFYPN